MADIFISYASGDREAARRLADALAGQGWSVFWDRTIPPGKTWCQVVGAALTEAFRAWCSGFFLTFGFAQMVRAFRLSKVPALLVYSL